MCYKYGFKTFLIYNVKLASHSTHLNFKQLLVLAVRGVCDGDFYIMNVITNTRYTQSKSSTGHMLQ